jgi:ATP-dependent Lhr-like helicase
MELLQAIRNLLLAYGPCSFADEATNRALAARREDMADLPRRELSLQIDGGSALWWTFAGGRINYPLKHGLEIASGWKVVADNFYLRVEGAGVFDQTLRDHIRDLARAEFWDDASNRRAILARLPEYRLSKFQAALPDKLAVEVVGVYLLDFDGAARWLGSALAR